MYLTLLVHLSLEPNVCIQNHIAIFSKSNYIILSQTNNCISICFSKTTILDGRTGKPLLPKPVKMVVGTQSSPLVVSVNGKGNDIFLYWVSDCHGGQNQSELEFDFMRGNLTHIIVS